MSRILALVGPTASGKSELALALANELGAEIVACDSVQVYRGFDVGSAKPSARERARTPHHLIDVADWREAFDAQRYRTLASAALRDIAARGSTPLLCGGSGLYLRALRWGLMATPPVDPELRARLFAEEAEEPGSLHARLLQLDPASGRSIDADNLVRVARALEICLSTGEAASALRDRHGFAREEVALEVLVLQWPAEQLRQRIVARSRQMLEAGLVEEVRELLAQGVPPDCRPMRAVGYREACAVARGEASLSDLAERIATSTWAYARRQRTWLRREREVRVVPIEDLRQAGAQLLAQYRR